MESETSRVLRLIPTYYVNQNSRLETLTSLLAAVETRQCDTAIHPGIGIVPPGVDRPIQVGKRLRVAQLLHQERPVVVVEASRVGGKFKCRPEERVGLLDLLGLGELRREVVGVIGKGSQPDTLTGPPGGKA